MSSADTKPLSTFLERLNASLKVAGTEAELQAQARKEHEQVQMALLRTRLADWGVGLKERLAVLDRKNLVRTKAIGYVVDALKKRLSPVVLWGGTGAGKSVAAACWLSQTARLPVTTAELGTSWQWDSRTKFATVFDLQRRARSFDPKDRAWMDDVLHCRALVLDDLGQEAGDLRAQVSEVIFERHRQGRLTCITTNLSPEAFASRYDDRNVSRILEAGAFLDCGSTDLRAPSPASPVALVGGAR